MRTYIFLKDSLWYNVRDILRNRDKMVIQVNSLQDIYLYIMQNLIIIMIKDKVNIIRTVFFNGLLTFKQLVPPATSNLV